MTTGKEVKESTLFPVEISEIVITHSHKYIMKSHTLEWKTVGFFSVEKFMIIQIKTSHIPKGM